MVVLPEPLGPIGPSFRPESMWNDAPSRACQSSSSGLRVLLRGAQNSLHESKSSAARFLLFASDWHAFLHACLFERARGKRCEFGHSAAGRTMRPRIALRPPLPAPSFPLVLQESGVTKSVPIASHTPVLPRACQLFCAPLSKQLPLHGSFSPRGTEKPRFPVASVATSQFQIVEPRGQWRKTEPPPGAQGLHEAGCPSPLVSSVSLPDLQPRSSFSAC